MILDQLREQMNQVLDSWAKTQGLDGLPPYALEEPPTGIESDVACNLAMILAKPLRKSPRALAEDMRQTLEGKLPLVEGLSIAGAGFLNFQWTLKTLRDELKKVLTEKDSYGRLPEAARKKILIEFVSANPTGPLHVGHGRGAALGDSLALILSHLGHQVTREYYLNDAGNQVAMLGESLLVRTEEVEGKTIVFPENGYHGEYVKELAKEFAVQVPAAARTPEKAIEFALARLTKNIESDLEKFGVKFDSWFSEASLVKKGLVEKHIQKLKDKGFVEEAEGALWFVAPTEKAADDETARDKNRVLKKKDGKWTYFASDIAYHADKFERGYDVLIDIWGADHHGYVPRVKGSMQALGFDPSKLHVILNQLVALTRNGEPVVMSKRSGEFVTLRDVLDEVGKDACRFFFAMRGPNTALDFDLELAKKHTVDNPVYYLQYAHARICSIFRQAGSAVTSGSAVTAGAAVTAAAATTAASTVTADLSLLKEKEERDLMKRLALFPQVLNVCFQDDSPHPLANYLMLLARQFHHFYDHHRVLGDDPALSRARLALLDAVRQMLMLGLALLGVSAPESM